MQIPIVFGLLGLMLIFSGSFRRRIVAWFFIHRVMYRPAWQAKIRPTLKAFFIAFWSIFTRTDFNRRRGKATFKLQKKWFVTLLKPLFDVRMTRAGKYSIVLRQHNRG